MSVKKSYFYVRVNTLIRYNWKHSIDTAYSQRIVKLELPKLVGPLNLQVIKEASPEVAKVRIAIALH